MPGYVTCPADFCVHRAREDEMYPFCMAPVIELQETEGRYECASYRDYHGLEDYQEPFYKVMKTARGPGRVPCKGKKIEINGYEFYTDDHPQDVEDGYAMLTHGPSGLAAGSVDGLCRMPSIREKMERTCTFISRRGLYLSTPRI